MYIHVFLNLFVSDVFQISNPIGTVFNPFAIVIVYI